ncbi:hypothetical protein LZ30DRAFT_412058 [Colletotrichum cereale]|nr:hypothetical protein LZ30DRAFT_412058 [Colletotrichum cereale]
MIDGLTRPVQNLDAPPLPPVALDLLLWLVVIARPTSLSLSLSLTSSRCRARNCLIHLLSAKQPTTPGPGLSKDERPPRLSRRLPRLTQSSSPEATQRPRRCR